MKKMMLLSMLAGVIATTVSAQSTGKMLRHVVLFQFKESASPADIKKVEDAFLLLPSKIDLIKGFEWGTNNSPEKLNEGLTHVFFASFANDQDRDAYLVHPAHKAFVEVLKPYLEKAVVIDYWTK